jgi:4-hydroxy-tetrahydrodipicolinate synthase
MKQNKLCEIKGVIPPLITPLNENYDLDVDSLERLIEHVIAGGVHGIFILGTTGELSRLDFNTKVSVIKNTLRIVNNRVPVLVGITDTSFHESLKLEKIAAESGAHFVVAAPPFYYHVTQAELLEYYTDLARNITLPLYLYNMPSRTNISIDIDTVEKTVLIPGIIGIKDSSCDFFYLQKLLYVLGKYPEFSVFVGPEEFLAQSVQLGANGGVNGGANLFPELYVKLFNAASENDIDLVNRLQNVVTQISSTLYQIGEGQPNFIKILKEAMYQKGICQPYMAKPYIPYFDSEKLQIAECLSKIELASTVKV